MPVVYADELPWLVMVAETKLPEQGSTSAAAGASSSNVEEHVDLTVDPIMKKEKARSARYE